MIIKNLFRKLNYLIFLISENENQFNVNEFFENRLKIFEHFICFNFSASSNEQRHSFLLSYYIQLLHKRI